MFSTKYFFPSGSVCKCTNGTDAQDVSSSSLCCAPSIVLYLLLVCQVRMGCSPEGRERQRETQEYSKYVVVANIVTRSFVCLEYRYRTKFHCEL
jgi:hypothetical protein